MGQIPLDLLRSKDDPDLWLKLNTIECTHLRARMSMAQCKLLRSLPTASEVVDMAQWKKIKNTPAGRAYQAGIRRPFSCDTCSGKDSN